MTSPPPVPTDPKPTDDAVDARIALLRSEMKASADRPRQAVLQYEVGHLLQHKQGNEPQAVREYLTAYKGAITDLTQGLKEAPDAWSYRASAESLRKECQKHLDGMPDH